MDNSLQTLQEHQTSTTALVLDSSNLEKMMSVANVMASSKVTVPQHFRNSTGDCLAVVMQAMQWKMNPFAVAQKTHLVNGTLGYEAQLVNAVIQTSGSITGRFHYEYQGDGATLSCRVGAVIAGESEITWGEWLKSSDVTTKNSPLWKTNPKQQLGYLQVKNWARLYCPGAILGVYTPDELDQSLPAQGEKDITPASQQPEQPQAAAEKPEYPDERLAQKLPEFKKKIDAGNSAASVIAFLSANYTLSPAQQARINALEEPAPIEGEARQVDDFLQEMAAEEAQQ